MCGIAGIIKRKNIPITNKTVIDRMLQRIYHRGPDDTGVCGLSVDNKLYSVERVEEIGEKNVWGLLGFNRLSIQDIGSAGHQPMLSEENDIVITFNGEIYNVNELRTDMRRKGYCFRGNSDTEVILCLYQEYGFMEMIQKLNGMFGIVLYDVKLNTIYLARDRFGIIPLHIYISENQIAYASEIKSLLELPDFERTLNLNSVYACLNYVYPNDSLYENIQNILPGTVTTYNRLTNEINTIKFFDIDSYRQRKYSPNFDYISEAREVLDSCVHRQLISDVELGVQLSGGVDSTLLAHIVSKYFKLDNKPLYGFSMTNRDAPSYDEEKYIDYAASLNDIHLKKVDMCFDNFIGCLERSVYAFERPFYLLSPIGIYLFSKEAKKRVKVLTSGEGADEIGGGYSEIFGKCKSFEIYFQNNEFSFPLEYDSVHGSHEFIEYFDKIRNIKTLPELKIEGNLDSFIEKRQCYWNSLHGTPFDKLRKMHFRYKLVSMLERQNKVCMANSIENRVPFLDNEFVEYMFSLPEEILMYPQKTNQSFLSSSTPVIYEGKYLLKKMNESIYGHDFAFRKKQAIYVPLMKYMSDPKMIRYIYDIIIPPMKKRGLIDVGLFERRLRDITIAENVVTIWKLVNMELWMQYFVDGKTEFYHK